MRPVRYAQIAGGGVIALGLHLSLLTQTRLRVHDVPLAVPGWPAALDGLRVAVIGDVHVGSPFVTLARVRRMVERVTQARPDLVLLLGDHVADVTFARAVPPEDAAEALAGLRESAQVVGVLGNHDWDFGGERVRKAFEAHDLTVLEEQAVPVLDGRLWVAGVGDLWRRTPRPRQALADVPEGAPTILLTHNPDVVAKVPATVQLVLAGHTHGGQVRVLGRALHRISKKTGNRWSHGWYRNDRLFITSGIGTSKWPIRNVVPEVPVLVLRPA